MRRLVSIMVCLMTVLAAQAQMMEPVHFTSALKTGKGDTGEIVFTATIDNGWHVYSTDLGQDGPVSATFNTVKMEGVETVGKLTPRGHVVTKFDDMFGMELRFFEHAATFVQKIRFTKPRYAIECFLEYGACNDQMCLPPTQVSFTGKGEVNLEEAKTEKDEAKAGNEYTSHLASPDSSQATTPVASATGSPLTSPDKDTLWQPVDASQISSHASRLTSHASLFSILLMGFVGGLLAVCMPCIWPIIPMTVSFFLKRGKKQGSRKGLRDALLYGLSIIVIYLALGLLVTACFGSDTLNAMSTNAVFNIFLFLLLVVFALSFFGWFEIKLPSSWANAVDAKADSLSHPSRLTSHALRPSPLSSLLSSLSSLFSIFLMAFTLVLVSFSCTAPIVGLLLVETTTSGNWLAPAVGMLGFAVALALPFTLFALFPSWLKQAPKSGSWMTTLKVVLGFIELAFALKFFSVADLAYGWHLLDREVFLSLWIVIFALLGAYLCGWLRFQQDELSGDTPHARPVVCIMGGLVSFAFALYMVPGLWGAPCKAVSAFAPPISTQDFNLNTHTVEARFTDYEQGMATARAEGKPVFLDFTGFGCVNCRKMEAAVWTDPRVADRLTNDYVLVSLYVDDKTPLAEPFEVTDADGHTRTLRTVGAKWSYLESHKFGANAQPFYVILDPTTATPLTGSRAYDEDVNAFLQFLNQGLSTHP